MKRTELKRKSELKRNTPLRPRSKKRKPEVWVGKHTGKVRLSGLALEKMRERRYRIDGGCCQYKGCGVWLPLYGSPFNRAHLAHHQGRGASGSDTIENTRIMCFYHHIEVEHTKGKSYEHNSN